MGNSQDNWLSPTMRVYVAKAIASSGREIRCEKCGSYDNLELHHKKYLPENVSIDDISILCSLCHRKSYKSNSNLKTVFVDGDRVCEVGEYSFKY